MHLAIRMLILESSSTLIRRNFWDFQSIIYYINISSFALLLEALSKTLKQIYSLTLFSSLKIPPAPLQGFPSGPSSKLCLIQSFFLRNQCTILFLMVCPLLECVCARVVCVYASVCLYIFTMTIHEAPMNQSHYEVPNSLTY